MTNPLQYRENDKNSYFSAFTVDVEDGINISMRDNFNIGMDPTNRVERNVNIILDICERNGIKATFFILGEIAEHYPDLIKKVYSCGHEIGIHGYHHDQIFKLDPDKLFMELKKAKDLMENLTGNQVYGFRAPAFSINPKTAWALPVIAKCGFKYDSSIYPSLSLRYGWKDFSKNICKLNLENSTSIIEVPLSVVKVMGRDIPVCGGGYLRYFPYWFTRKSVKNITKERPAIVYMHPYELDTEKYPDYFYEARNKAELRKKLPLLIYRFKKETVQPKLEKMGKEFRFLPLIKIVEQLEKNDMIPHIPIEK